MPEESTGRESMGKHLILQSGQSMNDALDLLDRFDQLRYADVKRIITVGVWNEKVQTGLFQTLDRAQRRGVPSPALIKNMELELRRAVAFTFRVVNRMGGISGVGSLQFTRGERGTPWAIFTPVPHFLVRNYTEGQFGRISGLPRSGKTNLARYLLRKWTEIPNHVAISNIMPKVPLDSEGWSVPDESGGPLVPDDYKYVKDSKALFETIAQTPDGAVWLFILDEGGLIYGKADASTRRAKDLDKLVRVIGKLHGNFIIVEQRIDSVPTIIQEFAMNAYYAQRPGVISIDLKGPILTYQAWIRGFPDMSRLFDTYDIGQFDVQENVPSLLGYLSGQKDVKGAMKDWLSRTYTSSGHKFRKASGKSQGWKDRPIDDDKGVKHDEEEAAATQDVHVPGSEV